MNAGNGAYGYFGSAPWESLTPEQRLQWARSQPGSGIMLTDMAIEKARHPERTDTNYWDYMVNSIANNRPMTHGANVPYAASGLGMMSGDAGADIANAQQQTVQNYGPDPRKDYIPPAAMGNTPEAAQAMIAKQQARQQEWLTRMGQQAGQITGTAPGGYEPGAGRESQSLFAPQGETTSQMLLRRYRSLWGQ